MRKQTLYVVAVALLLAGTAMAAQKASEESYPAPRYPRCIVSPTHEQMLAAARLAVRQTYGFCPLGKINPGQTVHIFMDMAQDPSVFEAIKAAYAERNINALAIQT